MLLLMADKTCDNDFYNKLISEDINSIFNSYEEIIKLKDREIELKNNPQFKLNELKEFFSKSNFNNLNLNNTNIDPEDINLKEVWEKEKQYYFKWLNNYNAGEDRKKKIKSDVIKIFSSDVKTILDIKRKINSYSKGTKINSSFRNFIKYLNDTGKFKLNVITNFNAQIKGTTYSGIDNFIPNEKQVLDSLTSIYKGTSNEEYIICKLCVESGCRFTEIVHLIKTYDENKVEVKDNCVIYDINFKRAQKKAFYLYFHKKTFDLLIKNLDNIKKISLKQFFWKIKRRLKSKNIEVIDLKYYRKYLRTKLIEYGANHELADYIAGRESQSIGFRNYQEKKYSGLREYLKVYDYYDKLFKEVEK